MKLLEIKDLSISYDQRNMVLNHISFDIEKGKKVALVGKNGSGKSTLVRAILGLVAIQTGSIFVNGFSVDEKNINQIRKKVGIVFQNPDNQFVGNTVAEDIAFRLENDCVESKLMEPIIEEKLKQVDMTFYKYFAPSNLSGGQKQRVAVATNIVEKLDLLLLDEATSMLDPKGQREINSLIQNLLTENPDLSIIYITHNMDEIEDFDSVILLDNGQIAFLGTPYDLFTNETLSKEKDLDLPFKYKLFNELHKKDNNIKLEEINNLGEILCQLK
ncbi:MAG: ATP-binding cassette domain-containing protein [Bacilli bacterium]